MGDQLINTIYIRKQKDMDFDKLIFILKDKDGKKFHKIIDKPIIKYNITKPEYWVDPKDADKHMVKYIDKDKTNTVTCYYKDIYKSIFTNLKDKRLESFFYEAISSGNAYSLNKMHLDYRLHGSDCNIQDYYIGEYLKKYSYHDHLYGTTKAFFDIEVDGSNLIGFPEPEEAKVPVNVITLISLDNMESYSFCLEYDTDTYRSVMSDKEGFKDRIKEKYKDHLATIGKEIKFNIYEFSNEIDLLKAFFDKINNELRPDFCLAWNISFDFVYLFNRIINLGYKPEDIMCAKDIPYKVAQYRLDTRNQDPADRSDSFIVSGYTIYLDLMCLFANLRKHAKEDSYALDYIGEKEVGMKKDKIETNIKTFHNDNYESFLEYNIQDVFMLLMIELKNRDVDKLYIISLMTSSRIEKALKKTICLRNLASDFLSKKNQILSNNRAKLHTQENAKIKGAFVGDPNLIDDIGIKIVYDKSNKLMDCVVDFDLTALYPSIIIAFNISPESYAGRITVMRRNIIDEFEDCTKDFIDDYISNDTINFCSKWLKLSTIEEIISLFKK